MSSRFRPRFSVRTLAIFVTLVCMYFGAWEATKRYGVPKTPLRLADLPYIDHAEAPMPLIVFQDEFDSASLVRSDLGNIGHLLIPRRRFYIWLFGPKIKLPFESTWK